MSNVTYNKYWGDAIVALHELKDYENPIDPAMQIKEREIAFQHMSVLYIKYIQIYRKLEDSYDELLHPQKRRLLRDAVIACIGRLLEIKHILVDLESTDFHNYNDILINMNLTPDSLNVSIPRFLKEERISTVQSQRSLLYSLNAKDLAFGNTQALFPELSLADAIKIIQINERGRQGKLRAKYMQDIKAQALKEKELNGAEDQNDGTTEAVRKIQRVFRGYKDRLKYKKEMKNELIFLKMEYPTQDAKTDPVMKVQQDRNRRKLLQQQFEEDYLQALITTKEKILRMEGPDMKEAIQDEFRQWYMEFKRINGKFPEFPTEEAWNMPDFKFSVENSLAEAAAAKAELEKAEAAKANQKKGDKKEAKAEKKPEKKDGKKGDKKGKEPEEEEDPTLKFKQYGESENLKQLDSHENTYNNNWKSKDESDNFAQKHDQEIIKANKRKEVEAEIKKDVFEILQDELKNLKLAVERDGAKGKKGKKGKGGKKGNRSKTLIIKTGGKKGKKDKGKKGKKEKDLTANRTLESLVEELVKAGILQQTLIEYCVLPLTVPFVPEVTTMKYPKVATVLLFGPSGISKLVINDEGSGKTMLVQSLATEIGAQIFNLSPRNTAGQFIGKANVVKMIHIVFKVARLQGPSIIYIDGAEMIFAKKVPKDDTSDPKRIKKDLTKAIKLIRDHSEKVILIATTNKPWDGDAKTMLPVFDKVMYVPKPDYGSRLLVWTQFIKEKAPEQLRNINTSLLTRMSDNFSVGSIKLVCDRVMTARRIRTLRYKRLHTDEFVEQLLNLPPPNPEESKLFKDFCEKTNLVKQRNLLINGPEEEEIEPAKKGAKKK
ncbi:Dynein regulatory complex protein 11 [Globomyces sp. JEL0801]|nr:Dynein regulatory complex protein 11 [Globomyces sp. JEL0801]